MRSEHIAEEAFSPDTKVPRRVGPDSPSLCQYDARLDRAVVQVRSRVTRMPIRWSGLIGTRPFNSDARRGL